MSDLAIFYLYSQTDIDLSFTCLFKSSENIVFFLLYRKQDKKNTVLYIKFINNGK